MASTLVLQRRIKTAQNVSKTTRAMQMIAASKLKKAQEAALAARPYVSKLMAITGNMTNRVDSQALPAYMKPAKENGKTLFVVIAPDKGLCGGLITNLAREILKQSKETDMFLTVGKKIESPIAHMTKNLVASFPFGTTLPTYDAIYGIAKIIDEQFLTGKVDRVVLLSTHCLNVFTQKPYATTLLPIAPQEQDTAAEATQTNAFQLFEPNIEAILPTLLKRYMEMSVYQELLESYLAEQSARMISMQNATSNAKDIIEDLKLEYNKTRQAKITSEILDLTASSAMSN
jgi:F-type H+-transporting ATPase subunit gamma